MRDLGSNHLSYKGGFFSKRKYTPLVLIEVVFCIVWMKDKYMYLRYLNSILLRYFLKCHNSNIEAK